MQLERRALYNSLRLNWLLDPHVKVEPWQVEDYRSLTLDQLFNALKKYHFSLDRPSFIALAEESDTPEELSDQLIKDKILDAATQDEIYLLIFEIWRRMIPEKQSLSIFCDEMDYQIYLYDTGQASSAEGIEDALANLKMILDENMDNGTDPQDAFETICAGCANDLESFIYDFISTQIDDHNLSYASELIEFFSDYVDDVRAFDFLRTRVMADSDPEASEILIQQIVQEAIEEPDLEFNLEILFFLAKEGHKQLFLKLLKDSVSILRTEADFQDLLHVCEQYFHFHDDDEKELLVQKLFKERPSTELNRTFKQNDAALSTLFQILQIA